MDISRIMTPHPRWLQPPDSLGAAIGLMDRFRFRHLPVIEDGKVVGVLSDRDVLSATGWLSPKEHAEHVGPLEGTTVESCMSRTPVVVEAGTSVVQAALRLLDLSIGCLVVVDSEGALAGIVTETDLLIRYVDDRGLLNEPVLDVDIKVHEAMTSAPTTVGLATSLGDAAELCIANGIRHLPVVDGGTLVGMVSDRDLRRAAGSGRSPGNSVEEIAVRDVAITGADESLTQCAARMVVGGIHALPVVDGRQAVLGIVTSADVLSRCMEVYRDPTSESCGSTTD